METFFLMAFRISAFVCSYRTYEEWKRRGGKPMQIATYVLTVPMRNGNYHQICVSLPRVASSYRTYEEWKLSCAICTAKAHSVLTVPMRNGNNIWKN